MTVIREIDYEVNHGIYIKYNIGYRFYIVLLCRMM